MKRLSFSFLIVIVLSFIIVHSCSTEEDDTTAPNVVQTPEPEPPAPTQYSLTGTAGEGGTLPKSSLFWKGLNHHFPEILWSKFLM